MFVSVVIVLYLVAVVSANNLLRKEDDRRNLLNIAPNFEEQAMHVIELGLKEINKGKEKMGKAKSNKQKAGQLVGQLTSVANFETCPALFKLGDVCSGDGFFDGANLLDCCASPSTCKSTGIGGGILRCQ